MVFYSIFCLYQIKETIYKNEGCRMKLFQKNCQRETSEYNIHEEIEKVKAQIDDEYSNLQNSVDPDLIDFCIF